ncbi:MAG: hypothetical protein E7259_10005 [Lachnospiraceae bacterium]|nr:hypothetical protein [Lachnospiraceae bacterium]
MSIVCEELKRMYKGKNLRIVIVIGVVIVVLQTYWFVNNQRAAINMEYEIIMSNSIEYKNIRFFENSILEGWLGCENYSGYNEMLFLLFPFLAVMPFGISLYNEWETGYVYNIITRCEKKLYLNAKFLATFLGGGLAVVFPLLLSLIVAACYLPIINMEPMSLQARIGIVDMWGSIYLEKPIIYAFIYMIVDFVYGGIFACIALTVSKYSKNWFSIFVFPAVLHFFLYYGLGNLFINTRTYNPSYFINPSQISRSNEMFPLVTITIFIIIGIYILYYRINRKREVL